MATFKSLFEKAMLKIGAKSGVPTLTGRISIADNINTYVAPASGFFFIRGAQTSNGGYVLANTNLLEGVANANPTGTILTPVNKGDSVTFMTQAVTAVRKYFYYSVGGA